MIVWPARMAGEGESIRAASACRGRRLVTRYTVSCRRYPALLGEMMRQAERLLQAKPECMADQGRTDNRLAHSDI
jgi:hypothetical protein